MAWLEEIESRNTLICKRHLEWKARIILKTIQRGLGGSSSKQQVKADNVEELVGNQNNLFLIDLRNYHAVQ